MVQDVKRAQDAQKAQEAIGVTVLTEQSDQELLERVYTVSEVAQPIRVSRSMILRWIAAGEVKSFKVGREHRIVQSERDALYVRIGFASAPPPVVEDSPAGVA